MSARDIALVQWLVANVGPATSELYRLPQMGDGWSITAGHEHDMDPYDYHYRHFPDSKYEPNGRYGYWLQLDDANAAILKLNGLLQVK